VSPPDEKPTRRRRSAPVGASAPTLRAGRTPRARSRDDAETRRGAVGRNHEPGRGAGLEAARTSKAKNPRRALAPGRKSGWDARRDTETLRRPDTRVTPGALASRRSQSRARGRARVRSRVEGHGSRGCCRRAARPALEERGDRRRSPRRTFRSSTRSPPDVEGFQQRSARGASREKCPEHGDPGVARRAERRAVPAGGGTPPAVAGEEGPRLGGSKALEGRGTPRRAPASARRVTAARCERTRAGKNASRSTERPDRGGSGGRGPG